MAKGIGDVLYSLLSNDTDVSAIVGTKIFPFLAVDDIAYPYIVYTIEGIEPTDEKDGVSCLDIQSVDIELYSETLSEVKDLSIKVRNVLDRYSGTTEGIEIQSSSLQGEDGGYADEDRVFMQVQSYNFRLKPIYGILARTTDLAATAASDTQIDLTWTDNATGESGYEVWRSVDFVGWTLIATTAAEATSYSNTGLTASTAYIYRVRPTDGTNGSEWSNVVPARTSDVTVAQSGIAYQRPIPTGQLTVYRTGDDAWNAINNPYPAAPVYPVSYALIDKDATNPFLTLVSNNAFGNKNRFTDDLGLQTYTSNYVIDHLTGLGWTLLNQGSFDWNGLIDDADGLTFATFSDWRLPNTSETDTIVNQNATTRNMNYAPFNDNTNGDQKTSTTNLRDTTKNITFDTGTGTLYFYAISKVLATVSRYCRTHY